jgi:glycosyltransferase involved in cell wall biosynthesis
MPLKSLHILQIFNRYLEYGGEEGSVARIAGTLGEQFKLQTFYGSTDEQLARPFGKWRMPGWMIKNRRVLDELRDFQARENFSLWQIHNVFPAVSIAAYELAFELGVPVVQYLHNYRFGCAGGTNFRNGSVCTDCRPGHNLPAIRHRCWRGSLPATLAMTNALRRFWQLDPARSIHAFIAISEAQKNHHVEIGLPAERIHVVRHFLDAGPEPVHSPPPDGDVLFLGRLVEEKGLHLLLDAWARVDSHGRTLRIVGDGPLQPALRQKIDSMGLKNVALEGFVPRELHDALWRRAAFFVAPSVWLEPFGMVVLEAWRQARPVLATNLGSFPEMIRHGETGWLAEPTPDAFAATLQAALDAKDSCSAIGRAGRSELLDHYNKDRWLGEVSRVYRSVVASH